MPSSAENQYRQKSKQFTVLTHFALYDFFQLFSPLPAPLKCHFSHPTHTRRCHIEFEVLRYEWGMRVRRQRAVEHGSKKERWMWIEKNVKFFWKHCNAATRRITWNFDTSFPHSQSRANLTSSIFFFWLLEKHPVRSAISAKLGYLSILFFMLYTLFVWINVVYEKLAKHDVTNNTVIFIISSRQQQVSAYLKSSRKFCISLTSMEACRTLQSSLAVILWQPEGAQTILNNMTNGPWTDIDIFAPERSSFQMQTRMGRHSSFWRFEKNFISFFTKKGVILGEGCEIFTITLVMIRLTCSHFNSCDDLMLWKETAKKVQSRIGAQETLTGREQVNKTRVLSVDTYVAWKAKKSSSKLA